MGAVVFFIKNATASFCYYRQSGNKNKNYLNIIKQNQHEKATDFFPSSCCSR